MSSRRRRRTHDDASTWKPRRGVTVPGMFALFVIALLGVAVVLGVLAELQRVP